MANINKRQLLKISNLTLFTKVIKENDVHHLVGGSHWTDVPPDMWDKEARELFDIMGELEDKLKTEILKIITEEK
jgi:hypothetical protein